MLAVHIRDRLLKRDLRRRAPSIMRNRPCSVPSMEHLTASCGGQAATQTSDDSTTALAAAAAEGKRMRRVNSEHPESGYCTSVESDSSACFSPFDDSDSDCGKFKRVMKLKDDAATAMGMGIKQYYGIPKMPTKPRSDTIP